VKIVSQCLLIASLLLVAAPAWASVEKYKLSWQAGPSSSTDEQTNAPDGFVIERKLGKEAYAEIGKTAANVLAYTDTVDNPAPGKVNVCYRVKAFNKAGESGPTNEVCVLTPQVDPPSLTVTPDTVAPGDSVTVEWRDIHKPAVADYIKLFLSDGKTSRGTPYDSQWKYDCTRGSGSAKSAPASGKCTLTLLATLPAAEGYTFRLFKAGSDSRTAVPVAISNPLAVSGPALTLPAAPHTISIEKIQ
jgi:hypothetical protein